MAAPKRTPFQREKDLQTIASLYLRGMYQSEIAGKVGLSQQQVSYDLKTLQRRWQESALADIDAKKAAELAKYDELEREYWDAWTRSKDASRKTRAVKWEDGSTATVEETQQVGDPRYLQGVERCIERRCAVIGIDAPKKIAPTDPTGTKEYASLSDDERVARVAALLERARARRDGQATGDSAASDSVADADPVSQ